LSPQDRRNLFSQVFGRLLELARPGGSLLQAKFQGLLSG
jgi:hypothetical protein